MVGQYVVGFALLLAAGCGSSQTTQPEPSTPSSPAYTTGGAAAGGQHTMPDGTTMPGREHMEHSTGQHVMPDGGVMPGHEHPQGATHVMPDGAVMPGHHHGGTP